MALSNWDSLIVSFGDVKSECVNSDNLENISHGDLMCKCGLGVEVYKNWLYIFDYKCGADWGRFTGSTFMEIQEGRIKIGDLNIIAKRGPQDGIYFLAWEGWDCSGDKGIAGCAVLGYESYSSDKYVGVQKSSVEFLKNMISNIEEEYNIDVPEQFHKLDFDEAARQNQGDAFFAGTIGTPENITKPGEADDPILTKFI